MKGLTVLIKTELKLSLREPVGTFFTLIFPLILLALFGAIYGNKPSPFFGGVGYIDTAVPSFGAMIIATSGLMGLAVVISTYREFGILRRLQITPLRPAYIIIAHVAVSLLSTSLGFAILIIAAKFLFHLRFSGSVFSVILAFLLSSCSFLALGFVIAGVVPTARTAQIVSMALFFPMLFLSGAAIPWEMIPPKIQTYALALPLTHVVKLLRGIWSGHSWSDCSSSVVYLSIMLFMGFLISIKTFRWE